MSSVKSYKLPPTKLIPNSPKPLLHYQGLLSHGEKCDAIKAYDLMTSNGWQVQWIFRYGPTQKSHYHSAAHECMAVLTGEATIRFGVADTDGDLDESTYGSGKEDGGIDLHARAGDVSILPAGVAQKTFDTSPPESFALVTPGNLHGVSADNDRAALASVELSGFTMIGPYPAGSVWDFREGGENSEDYQSFWAVPKPENDPVLGKDPAGLIGLWD